MKALWFVGMIVALSVAIAAGQHGGVVGWLICALAVFAFMVAGGYMMGSK